MSPKKVQPTVSLVDEKKQSVENTTPKESTKTAETVEQVKPNPPEKKKSEETGAKDHEFF